jgi:histidine triad (HIT) family protein
MNDIVKKIEALGLDVHTWNIACPFCKIIAGLAPATIVREWDDALAIEPLGPVVPGHLLVIPKTHVVDFLADPDVTAATFRRAAELGSGDANLITSSGVAATQSVFHLHVHLVPRAEGDGLALPWSSGKGGDRG